MTLFLEAMVCLKCSFEGWVKRAQETDVSQELELSTCRLGIQTVFIFEAILNMNLILLGSVIQPHENRILY